MEINREKAVGAFKDYVAAYDSAREKIRLKIEHTFRVCSLCERIAREENFDREDTDIAWLLGLLHDVGRFEQLRQYGTFNDAQSIDHAQFGADILFKDGRISDYIQGAGADEMRLLEKAIRFHSAYRLEPDMTERERKFANLLRDADKIDILKVNVDFPLEEIYNCTTKELRGCKVSDEVMQAFNEEHAVLRSLKKTPVDNVVGHISLVYELVYPVSLRLVREQGYLDRLMDFESDLAETMEQFERIRRKMGEYIGEKMTGK